jgi:hypothetical protein
VQIAGSRSGPSGCRRSRHSWRPPISQRKGVDLDGHAGHAGQPRRYGISKFLRGRDRMQQRTVCASPVGVQHVQDYVPHESGKASFLAGPKVVCFERAEWTGIPDGATAAAALHTGGVGALAAPRMTKRPYFTPIFMTVCLACISRTATPSPLCWPAVPASIGGGPFIPDQQDHRWCQHTWQAGPPSSKLARGRIDRAGHPGRLLALAADPRLTSG